MLDVLQILIKSILEQSDYINIILKLLLHDLYLFNLVKLSFT